jgi:hypothetical protein
VDYNRVAWCVVGEGFNTSTRVGDLLGVAASFHAGDDFIRVWYLSNGQSVLLVSYVCSWESREVERQQYE